MYEEFFGFSGQPFASVARVDHYFPAPAIEAVRVTLARCIERGEGAGMVVGASGLGKTLLCQVLAEQFQAALRPVILSSGRLSTRRALLQAILYELGRPYRDMDEGDLRLALVDYVSFGEDCPQGILLLVDEAHTLPLRLLDELRMLTNIAAGGQPRVRLVLAGGPALEERMANPRLDSFSQRLVRRCYLEPFSRQETREYVHARLTAVGADAGSLMPEQTCDTVHKATDGIPRLVNQVCDQTLLLAYAAGCRHLAPAHVEEAWADLQQLPSPCNAERSAPGGHIIEFGHLDDTPAEPGDDAASVPALRLAEGFADEPGEQLDRIEGMIAEAEDDFEPAGSIGPEVELVFDEAADPFREEFEHEEPVVDRYSARRRVGGGPAVGQSPAAPRGATEAPRFEPQTVPLHRETPRKADAQGDENIIVVEDDYEDSPMPSSRPVAAVRRHEYGQLFAKLRRG